MDEALPRIVMGLGNPGPEYENTYHNAGFLALDSLVGKNATWRSPGARKRFAFIAAENRIYVRGSESVFMNESGKAAKEALAYFKAPPEKLLLVHDDSDLPLGEIRFSKGRGAAGHKGVASVIEALGTKDFSRARVGVRNENRDAAHRLKAEEFVLRAISPADRNLIEKSFEKLGEALEHRPGK